MKFYKKMDKKMQKKLKNRKNRGIFGKIGKIAAFSKKGKNRGIWRDLARRAKGSTLVIIDELPVMQQK